MIYLFLYYSVRKYGKTENLKTISYKYGNLNEVKNVPKNLEKLKITKNKGKTTLTLDTALDTFFNSLLNLLNDNKITLVCSNLSKLREIISKKYELNDNILEKNILGKNIIIFNMFDELNKNNFEDIYFHYFNKNVVFPTSIESKIDYIILCYLEYIKTIPKNEIIKKESSNYKYIIIPLVLGVSALTIYKYIRRK